MHCSLCQIAATESNGTCGCFLESNVLSPKQTFPLRKISKALFACSASESQTQNKIMRAKFWPPHVASNTVKETEYSNGNISQIRKRKEWLSVLSKGDRLKLILREEKAS